MNRTMWQKMVMTMLTGRPADPRETAVTRDVKLSRFAIGPRDRWHGDEQIADSRFQIPAARPANRKVGV
jgi:hypothetical protein